MVLHPQARRAVELTAGQQKVFDPDFDIAAARIQAQVDAAAQPREDVAEVRDLDADGVRCRLYRPADSSGALIVHLHGGGFVFNDIEVHDAVCRQLANRSGMDVLSVDYRRPPEHRFPAAPDDVDTVLGFLARTGEGPLYAHGDSAGANLALVAALRNPGRFRAVALIYPFLDPTASFASYAEATDVDLGGGFGPSEATWYWEQYAASPEDLTDPDLAPLLSDRLASLPPTMILTAEHDPLRDEGEHLAMLLAEQGVEVVAARQLGQIHGFWRHAEAFDAAEPALRSVAGFLRQHCP
jgi:acetyl esterase